MENIPMETNSEIGDLKLVELLSSLKRKSPIPGMENELVPDPVAEELLNAGPDNLTEISIFLKNSGISNLNELPDKWGFSAVVLDAGDRVIRLSKNQPTAKPDAPYVLRPESQKKIGNVYVQISKKVSTGNISEADVESVRKDLAAQGYEWDDAGTDNLGRDEKGNLMIIDGSVKKVSSNIVP